jgi:homoaconitate hydratase
VAQTSVFDICGEEETHVGQTIVEKIAQLHLAEGSPNRPLRAGDFVSIRPRHVMTHDNTSAVMKKFRAIGAQRLRDPRQPVFALDHDIQNTSESNLTKYREVEAFAREQGVDFYPAGTGIGHQIMVEKGYVLPGSFVVASDSHSNMYGALGAVGTPVVRTDAAAIWATGEFWWQIPPAVRVELTGALAPGVAGKDVIITLCGLYNQDEVLNAALEFCGEGVASLDMEARLTIANMSTEWGALVGWFPADATTFAFLRECRAKLPAGTGRLGEDELAKLEAAPPVSDADAAYSARITLDLATLTPHISGPDTVQVGTPLSEIEKQRIKIDKAYIVSCVNSRLGDLAEAARVLEGKKLAPGVKLYLAAASLAVQQEAGRRGYWQTLVDAGAVTLPSGCGPCIGLGAGVLEPGEIGISATNRNFKGRMGSRDAKCYLASPSVVAASAAAGYIAGPKEWPRREVARRFERATAAQPVSEKVQILEGFPTQLRGRLVFLPADNLNTDGIYGKDYTYRDNMTKEKMARAVMENYDPEFARLAGAGDILVGGFNFGTGSSREQAVTALQAKGISLVIAGSFSQTYLRNAFNNGYPCVESPRLVERLREQLASQLAQRTIIPGEELLVDFSSGTLEWRGERFPFAPLGRVAQSLVIAGGVEKLVKQKLGLS